MPIYQRPIENIGITKIFSGTITDSGSTAIEGAVVALKRRGSGAILYADTDASGNYSFNIDADGDFQIEYLLSKDSSVRTTTEEIAPAKAYADYGNDQVPMAVADFPQTTGSGASFYIGTPSVSIVDITGLGTGATVSITMANISDPYASFSSRVVLDSLYAGVAKPLRQYTISNLGSGYETPKMRITGTQVLSTGLTPEQLIDQLGITTGFLYDGQNFYTEERTRDISCITRQIGIVGAVGVEQVLGSDHSLWGTYDNDYRGGRCTAAFAGEQDKSNFDSSSTISAADAELISIIRDDAVYSVNNHQFQIYGKVIYTGVSGIDNNGVFTGQGEDSAVAAYPSKITLKELDILKGYFGRYGLIEGILPVGQTTTTAISNFFNFGYQMIQGISSGVSGQYSADSPNNWMYETNGGNKSTLFTAVAKEFRSFLRQKSGVDIPESAFGTTIYPILQKAGITFRYVGAGSQRQRWTFTSNGIIKVSDPE